MTLSNPPESLGGRLRLRPAGGCRPEALTRTVDCVGGQSRPFEGRVSAGPQPTITGALGGVAIRAVFRRDPPDPGTPLPYLPTSVAESYRLTPWSLCFGGGLRLAADWGGYSVQAADPRLGTVT